MILRRMAAAALLAALPALASPPDFEKEIEPLLARHCLKCHGPEKQKGGLRLDSRENVFKGGDSGHPAVVPGDAKRSRLMELVSTSDESMRMPSKDGPLSAEQIALLRRWIEAGALWPDSANVEVTGADSRRELRVTAEDREHWAFRPLFLDAPRGQGGNWVDLSLKPLGSFAEAPRHQLIRRLYFGLLGLPPTPEEVDAFVNDSRPAAYEDLVDRLLASKHYGERWGRHWLDVARYADSDGYENDLDRPEAWPYRDWVIRAFNQDLPFDTFVKWQLAGDEYEPANPDAVIATGFLAAGPSLTTTPADTEENKLKIRYDELDDMVSTASSAFLGLTAGCARCHDHKFDPIPTRDYYRLVAAFSTTERRVAPLSKPAREFEKWKEDRRRDWREARMTALNLGEEEKFWLRQPEHFFVPVQKELYKKHGRQLEVSDENLRAWLPEDQRVVWDALNRAAVNWRVEYPAERSLVVLDRQAEPAAEFLLERGGVTSRAEAVTFGFLQVMTRGKQPEDYWSEARSGRSPGSGVDASGFVHPRTTYQRKALAAWLTDVEQGAGPLLARVMMNRVWQHHFGQGFTSTPNDAGFQSEDPRWPELLEALAAEFVRGGWKLKPVHRQIVLSKFYRAASGRPACLEQTGGAELERRPVRLEAEALRDAMLAVSGRLNRAMFGPPFRPIIPKEAIATRSKDAYPADIQDGPGLWRRSVYAFAKRSVPNPFFEVFDSPDLGASCGRRNTTTVPTQALTLLNNELVRHCAVQFAQRVITEAGLEANAQIDRAYRLALNRPPAESERVRARQFLDAASDAHGEGIPVEGLTDLCHLLFTLNEFIYVD